jgi:hypothetical protein
MRFQHDHSRGRRAVAILATCFVVLGGAAACAAIAMSADFAHPEAALLPIAGIVAGMLILVWLLREPPAVNHLKNGWTWLSQRRRHRVAYHVKPRLPPSQRSPAPSGPPTAESIRQITGRQGTWVPTPVDQPLQSPAGHSDTGMQASSGGGV